MKDEDLMWAARKLSELITKLRVLISVGVKL